MATNSGARRKPQRYPDELRERAVRMVQEIRRETGETHGVISGVAKDLGMDVASLRGWVNRAELDSGRRAGTTTADAQRIAELTMENRELRRANDMAAWTRRGPDLAGLICHHDAGSQYTSIAHTDAVAGLDARGSIGTVGDSFDNAMAGSVNALYKTELHRNPAALAANGGRWKGLDDLEVATCA